jgi:hypothetical protein
MIILKETETIKEIKNNVVMLESESRTTLNNLSYDPRWKEIK